MSCIIQGIYNQQEHFSGLKAKVIEAWRSANVDDNIDTIMDKVIQGLKTDPKLPFSLDFKEGMDPKEFSESLRKINADIARAMTPNMVAQLRKPLIQGYLANTFYTKVGVSEDVLELTKPDTFKIIFNEAEEETDLDRRLARAYPNNPASIDQMSQKFQKALFTNAVANFDTGKLVLSNGELQFNISAHKAQLFKTLVEYLKTKGLSENISDKMYVNNEVGLNYYQVMDIAEDIFKDTVTANRLSAEHVTRNTQKTSALLDALDAYTMLANYDDLIERDLGNAIAINKRLRGKEVKKDADKYSFALDTSHQYKTWAAEDVSSIQTTSKYSQFVLNHLPLESKGIAQGRTIGVKSVAMTFSKLHRITPKLLENYDINVKKFGDLIISIADHPNEKIKQLLELVQSHKSVQKFLSNLNGLDKFTTEDFAVLESLHKYVFGTSTTPGFSSIAQMEQSGNIGQYSIVNDISGVINDVSDASYLEVQYDFKGNPTLRIREKYSNRRKIPEDLKVQINASVALSQDLGHKERLAKSWIVTFPTSTGSRQRSHALVSIPISITDEQGEVTNTSINFTQSTGSNFGILGNGDINIDVKGVKNADLSREVITTFRQLSEFLTNGQNFEDFLSGSLKGTVHQAQRALIQQIDERLHTNFLSREGLKVLQTFLANSSEDIEVIKNLLIYSTKAQVVSDLYLDYAKQLQDGSHEGSYTFDNYMSDNYRMLSDPANNKEVERFYTSLSGKYILNSIGSEIQWVDELAYAISVVSGNIAPSTSKNMEGNSEANYSATFLAEQFQGRLQDAREAPEGSSSQALLFTHNPGSVGQVVIQSQIKNAKGDVKSVKDLKASELFQHSIFHGFWLSAIHNKGSIYVQPTTYSDKTKIVNYLVSTGLYKGLKKPLFKMNPVELSKVFAQTIGEAAKRSRNHVIDKYKIIFDDDQITLDEINDRLATMNADELVELAQSKGVVVNEDLDYRIRKGAHGKVLGINETLNYLADFNDPEIAHRRLEEEKIRFLNDLINSGSPFMINGLNSGENVSKVVKESMDPISQAIRHYCSSNDEISTDEFIRTWIINGQLVPARYKDGREIMVDAIENVDPNEVIMNPLLEKYFYIDSLASNNLRLSLTGFETAHPDKSKFQSKLKSWAGDLKVPTIFTDRAIQRVADGSVVVLNTVPLGSASDIDAKLKEAAESLLTPKGITSVRDFMLKVENGESIDESDKVLYSDLQSTLQKTFDALISQVPENETVYVSFDGLNTLRHKVAYTYDQVGNLSAKAIKAIHNDFNMYTISEEVKKMESNEENRDTKQFIEDTIRKINNMAQSTQLKRQVIAVGTRHNINPGDLRGPATDLKMAIISDFAAVDFNVNGEEAFHDAWDGSSVVVAEQSILENNALQSQEVGDDKKTIGFYYDENTSTSGLIKNASFIINNERMRASLQSEVSAYNLYKKATNLQWNSDNGKHQVKISGLDAPVAFSLTSTVDLSGGKLRQRSLDFKADVLKGRDLFYKTYEEYEGKYSEVYRSILDFNYDSEKHAYFTYEVDVAEDGTTFEDAKKVKVYHFFDGDSNHIPITAEQMEEEGFVLPADLHTINSNFELWESLGGVYSITLSKEGTPQYNEDSHHAMVNFMNSIIIQTESTKDNPRGNLYQPLKNSYIAYLSNGSAVKNLRGNVNSKEKFFNNKPFTYMTFKLKGLGVQMNADHDVETAAEMTEASQVISSLIAGGTMQGDVSLIYQALEEVARSSSYEELKLVKDLLDQNSDPKSLEFSQLYDFVGKALMNNTKSKSADLADKIVDDVSDSFNLNINHADDAKKIPFSDPNLYSKLISTIASTINKKSVKRKYPGSGCVMVPSHKMISYFKIDGNHYFFDDLVRIAEEYYEENGLEVPADIRNPQQYEQFLVKSYLDEMQDKVEVQDNVNGFSPTDIVNVHTSEGIQVIKLESLKTYYDFKDLAIDPTAKERLGIKGDILGYQQNITLTKDLAPSKITFTVYEDGVPIRMNAFDLDAVRNSYKNGGDKASRRLVSQAFRQLHLGKATINGKVYDVTDIDTEHAELVVSNIYSSQFGDKGKSLAEVRDAGPEFFKLKPTLTKYLPGYDITFKSNEDNDAYISFTSPEGLSTAKYNPHNKSNLVTRVVDGRLSVFKLNRNGTLGIKVGEYVEAKTLHSDGEKILNNKGEVVSNKNLKVHDGKVYKYVEFISEYTVSYDTKINGTDVRQKYKQYYVNVENINKLHNDPNVVKDLVQSIYNQGAYISMDVNPQISSKTADNIFMYLQGININPEFNEIVLPKLFGAVNAISRSGTNEGAVDIKDALNEYYDILSQKRYVSWQQSHYFVSTRIPAQNLQSFMKMKVVGYTGNSDNKAYVSSLQTWLQGSDYPHESVKCDTLK